MQSEEIVKGGALILGGEEADGTGVNLSGVELQMDQTLAALYDAGEKEKSRGNFPASVVKV